MASPAIRKLLESVKADHERTVEELKTLTEIEAPPFKEQKRAEAFLARMKALGLTDAKIDAEGNVVGLRKGTGNGPKLLDLGAPGHRLSGRHRREGEGARRQALSRPASATTRAACRCCCRGSRCSTTTRSRPSAT